MTVNLDKAISSVTLAGSVLSCLATTCVLTSFAIYHRHLQRFRHVLVLNLVVAEFINTLNNSISGAIYLRTGELKPGASCIANGFIGQFSVQAADFSVLAIALVTLLTVTRYVYIPTTSATRKLMICVAIWAMPLLTSLIPTIAGEMEPVGGNWCWISASRSDLRYGMTHAWRFLVIFVTIAIYIYIWVYLRKQLSGTSQSSHDLTTGNNTGSTSSKGFRVMKDDEVELDPFNRAQTDRIVSSFSTVGGEESRHNNSQESRRDEIEDMDMGRTGEREASQDRPKEEPAHHRPTSSMAGPELADANVSFATGSAETSRTKRQTLADRRISEFPIRRNPQAVQHEINRMMLLTAYPFAYVLLWLPGLINRIIEASGKSTSPTTIAALQVSTQFVGFANALTYGFNHYLRDRLRDLYWTPAVSRIKERLRR